MTKQEYIEQLQDLVETNKITNIKDLQTQFVNEDGSLEPIEIYDEVLSPIEFNACDKCGALERTDHLCWVEQFPFEDDNKNDQAILKALREDKEDYSALCWECMNEFKNKGMGLPTDLVITHEANYDLGQSLNERICETIVDYLSEEYGYYLDGYEWNIVLNNIKWDTKD